MAHEIETLSITLGQIIEIDGKIYRSQKNLGAGFTVDTLPLNSPDIFVFLGTVEDFNADVAEGRITNPSIIDPIQNRTVLESGEDIATQEFGTTDIGETEEVPEESEVEQMPGTTGLIVNSTPDRARIFIDGVDLRDLTPSNKIHEVDTGVHVVEVYKNKTLPTLRKEINVVEGETSEVDFNFVETGDAQMLSTPRSEMDMAQARDIAGLEDILIQILDELQNIKDLMSQ